MNTPKRLLCATLLLAMAALGAAALDWGGTVDNSTAYYTAAGGNWDQKDKLALWLTADLGPTLTLEARGSYTYSLDRPYLFDLERLVLAGQVLEVAGSGSLLRYSVGRIPLRDPMGNTLDLTADGVEAVLGLPRVRLKLAAAYTGLLLKPVPSLYLSSADQVDNADDNILLAPRRLVGQLEARFPELFARQTLSASFLLQQDLRADSSQRMSAQYFQVGLGGPLAAGLYYDGSATLSTGRDAVAADPDLLALLIEGGVRWFHEELLNARFELRGLYATGDSGSLTAYRPITRPTLGLVNKLSLGDLLQVQVSRSFKPLASLQTYWKATASFQSTGLEYSGSELEAGVNWRIFSDLGTALAGGLWVPAGGDGATAGVKLDVSFAY